MHGQVLSVCQLFKVSLQIQDVWFVLPLVDELVIHAVQAVPFLKKSALQMQVFVPESHCLFDSVGHVQSVYPVRVNVVDVSPQAVHAVMVPFL